MQINCTVGDIVEFYNQYPEYIGKLQVETRFGFRTIEYADITKENAFIWNLELENGYFLECDRNHRVRTKDKWINIGDLDNNSLVLTRNGFSKVISNYNTDIIEDLVDLQVQGVNEYYSNGIVSHNSIFVEAISFALYGKPYRNTNKPSLVNWINDKDCIVEIEFEIGKIKYLVRRGIKPNILEIYKNKKLLPQDAKNRDYQKILEEDILKLNWKVFRQIVVLGSATYTPFMELSAADRRNVIENLLDIQVFSSMNVLLKQRISENKELENKINNQIEIVDEKIKIQKKHLDDLKQDVKKRAEQLKESCKSLIVSKQENISTIQNLRKQIQILDIEKEHTDISSKITKANTILSQFDDKLKRMSEELEFFNETKNCPTCKQEINEQHKYEMVSIKKSKIDETIISKQSLSEKLNLLEENLKVFNQKQKEISTIQKQIYKIQSEILSCDTLIVRYEKEIKDLENQKDDGINASNELKQYLKDRKKLDKEFNQTKDKKYYHDVLSSMLKDTGIKTTIIKQYLPIINKHINKYLADMNFFVDFRLDENFKECIKSRGVDESTYESFSEGEKLRMDLAILMTWLDITKMKNSVNTNIMIADEIFEKALDLEGIDDLVRIMKSVWKNSNVFVISPRGETMVDKFDEYIKFEKVNGFTRMIDE